jgi:CHAT domain-containing protein
LNHRSDPEVLETLEIYQDQALRFWLPKSARSGSGSFLRASYKLAQLLEQHDGDPWMREFLDSFKQADRPAVNALSAAIDANRKGLYGKAFSQSALAADLFARNGNAPGELRARLESIYASQRFLEGFDCLSRIAATQVPERYRWLQIQLALEKYTCSNFGGDFAAIQQGLESSHRQAEQAHYPILALRSMALAAGIKRQQQAGCREVWEHAIQGLGSYWQYAIYAPERLYQFYSILEQCASQMRLWHTAEALQRHSIKLLEDAGQQGDPNLTLLGSAHAELAAILAAQTKDADAEREQKAADSLWIQSDERTANTYRLFMRIHLAEVELNRGDAARAWGTLNSSRGLLASTQYQLLALNFYKTLGNTCWRLKRLSDAASAYEEGISIAESSLRSIPGSAKDRLQWVTKTDELYRGLTRTWLEQTKTAEAWKLWEWYKSRSLVEGVALEMGNEVSWKQIEEIIIRIEPPTQEHITYASFEDGVEIWTVTGSSIKAKWIPAQQRELQQMVDDFAEACADPSSSLSNLHTQAQELYRLLLQPAVSDLPEPSTVAIELDKSISRLVVSALIDDKGRYFAQNYAVVYSPGIFMEQSLRPAERIEAKDRVLLVDASDRSGKGVVPGHLEERRAAFEAYRQVKLVSGQQMSTAEIQQELAKSTVLDFIGHGEQHGSHTELRLSSRVSLKPQDFPPYVLRRLKLSILAACSTGSAGEDRLLDTDNLVHSFLSAGVPEVIASQWNVDSAATAQLMQELHARLGAGETVQQAMSQAQKDALAAHNHPYFWAGFNLSGRAN